MFDVVKFLVRGAYYYARLLGALNFEFDFRAGRVKLTTRTSMYAALLNVTTISILPFLSISQMMQSFLLKSGYLHKCVFSVLVGGRMLCVAVNLIIGWWQRQRVLRIVNAFVSLARKQPRVRRMWRRAVISKLSNVLLIQVSQIAMSCVLIRQTGTLRMLLSLAVLYTITEVGNVMISHYYFALLNIHGHYILLNEELRTLLAEISCLEGEQRRGVFTIKCCILADRIDCIAKTQFQLQTLVQWLTSICGLQTLFTTVTVYMATVIAIYMAFSELPGTAIGITWSNWQLTALLLFQFVLFFVDAYITINLMYSVLARHDEMVQLLAQGTVFVPSLDTRLEMVLESFKLQLAWNPLSMPVLGLFNAGKPLAIAMLSSAVSSSLVLVQYDLQNA